MSDATDPPDRDDTPVTNEDAGPVLQRMQQFLEDHEIESDARSQRRDLGTGRPLSEIVVEQREERL